MNTEIKLMEILVVTILIHGFVSIVMSKDIIEHPLSSPLIKLKLFSILWLLPLIGVIIVKKRINLKTNIDRDALVKESQSQASSTNYKFETFDD